MKWKARARRLMSVTTFIGMLLFLFSPSLPEKNQYLFVAGLVVGGILLFAVSEFVTALIKSESELENRRRELSTFPNPYNAPPYDPVTSTSIPPAWQDLANLPREVYSPREVYLPREEQEEESTVDRPTIRRIRED